MTEAERMIHTTRLLSLLPERTHRSTAPLGREHMASLKTLVDRSSFSQAPGPIVLIDFTGIEAATTSYLKETVLRPLLWAGAAPAGESGIAGEPPHHFYPVVYGLNDDLREGLDDMLALRRLFCLEVLEWEDDQIASAELRGKSDKFVGQSLQALQDHRMSTASEIQRATGGMLSVTGWNNRLYDLYRLRLAKRFKKDRQWVYEALAQQIRIPEEVEL